MEIGKERVEGQPAPFKIIQEISYPAEFANDFPVALEVSPAHQIIYILTKQGLLFLYDLHTGSPIYRNRVLTDTIFATCLHTASSGILAVTARTGKVVVFGINESVLVPFVANTLRNNELAIQLASRLNVGGAEELYVNEFNRLVAAGDVAGAAKIAADSPQGFLRTPETIQRFQQMPPQQGRPAPILQYFSALLEKGKLNAGESIELARPVLAQGKLQLLEKWIKEDKLEFSEQLGDLVSSVDIGMALSIYLRANCSQKVSFSLLSHLLSLSWSSIQV